MKKLIFTALTFLSLILTSTPSLAASCDIEQTSNGKWGVREYRASGWVYIVRNLSYQSAQDLLERLKADGRCD